MGIACMAKGFLPYSLVQRLLLAGHACGARRRDRALFVSDVVDALDQQPRPSGLSPGEDGEALGVRLRARRHVGAQAGAEDHRGRGLRVLSGDQHPDHDSIASFRPRHLGHLGALFARCSCSVRKREERARRVSPLALTHNLLKLFASSQSSLPPRKRTSPRATPYARGQTSTALIPPSSNRAWGVSGGAASST
jgi:hypothetical protein